MVAPALLAEEWCQGEILLLSPRRLAARMAAERIAELIGESVGQTVGYATRMDSKRSTKTRILVLTEGIFRNRIIADPELAGVSAIVFDEVHERSIDSDFGLALALDTQDAFRPDLRLLAMSATLDGARIAGLMGNAQLIESQGRSWPLELRYIGRRAEQPIEVDIGRAVRLALTEQQGDILVFLPGVREIERAADQLSTLSDEIRVHKLHGMVDPVAQRRAIKPDDLGQRKVILATNIAETSLTIEGVRVVVDSGLARRARFDQAAGLTRLVTERASLSAVTQRAGRAARQGPGIAYRLWEEAGNGGLPPFDPPEILESDLSSLVLDCASWGEPNPAALRWLDAPPKAALNEARATLIGIGAIEEDGHITSHGSSIAALPLPPRLAHMVAVAARSGQAEQGATLALLLQERGLGGHGEDIEARFERFSREKDGRAAAARSLARRIAQFATRSEGGDTLSIGALIAVAYPGWVAKRRDGKGEKWLSVQGRGLRLDPNSPLVSSGWLAVADMQAVASEARILSAAVLSESEVLSQFGSEITISTEIRYDKATDRINTRQIRRLGAIILAQGNAAESDPATVASVLLNAVREVGLGSLPWSEIAVALRNRAAYAGIDTLSDAALLDTLSDWLRPLLVGITRLRDLPQRKLYETMESLLLWDGQQRVDQVAPANFTSPAGTIHSIDYLAEAGPTVVLRVQALFGLDTHPCVGCERIPLVLSLTSPAGRPIQTTRNLPAFWRGSWHDVAKEMRGRYPKHSWPDAPWESVASLKTKKAQARGA